GPAGMDAGGALSLAWTDLRCNRADHRALTPEVLAGASSGFDALIGNPPFLGNRLWKSSMGVKLQWQCQMVLGTSPGKIDLCVVFHRRVVDLLRVNGCYGLLATSNIAEGSAVEVGLAVIIQNGNIFYSRKGVPWPGAAAIEVAIVGFIKGEWQADCDADGRNCPRIGPRLEPEIADHWVPRALSDAPFSFEGVNNSKGMAFVITPDSPWFERLKNETNSLLRPYITGDDITSYALRKTDRWALDIADRTLEEVQEEWPIAFRFLVEEVQPTRTPGALKSYKGLYDRWWQFWNHRADLMRRLRQRDEFVAFSKVTKYPICMPAPTDWIYTNKVLLIEMARVDLYAICLSSFFRKWLEVFSGGRLEGRLSLSISESVAKFPLPSLETSKPGVAAADRFKALALVFSAENSCGLTEVMNAVHTPNNEDTAISELRQLMVNIDTEVAAAYGWDDIEINYDFREFTAGSANDSWRWVLPENTTIELLARLTTLNRERSEVDGVNRDGMAVVKKSKRRRRAKSLPVAAHGELFDGDGK
ncbi:MAG: type IIL restriction-modification enzyme MmeI, partial [Candidatus Sedimenticola endophacoides]